MSGGFFRGTSADQDTRFSNKMAKLLKTQKFAPELDQLVDISKVQMDVIKPWIATRVTELLGFEDEVLINFIYGLLDGKDVDGKGIQIQLTGFMEKNTGRFMKELWGLLTSAQSNQSGIPQQFLDAKAEETKKKKEEEQRILSEVRKREEQDKESDLERNGKTSATETAPKLDLVSSPPEDGEKKLSDTPTEPHSGARNGSPGPRRPHSRSMSRSPPRKRHSGSPHRHARSPRIVRSPPRRRRSPVYSRSPPRRRKSPPGRSQRFARSPIRPRRRSPPPSRSPPRRRIGRSRSPRRRRSLTPSASPRKVHRSLSRSPPRVRRRSPSRSPPHPRARRRSPSRSPPHPRARRRSPSRSPPRPRTRPRSPSRSPPPPVRSRRRSLSRSPVPPPLPPARTRRRSPSRSPLPPPPPSHLPALSARRPSRSPPPPQPHLPRQRSQQDQGTSSRGPLGRFNQDRSFLRRPEQDQSGSRKQPDVGTVKKPRSVSPGEGDVTDGRRLALTDVHPPVTPTLVAVEDGKEKGGRKAESFGPVTYSDSEDLQTGKVASDKVKVSKGFVAQDVVKGQEDGSVSPKSSEDRRDSKRRKREEKRLRKEEKRKRRDERHKRKEEKRAARTASKVTGSKSDEQDDEEPSGKDLYNGSGGERSEGDDVESEQKRLRIENELRKKALDSLRAKKAVS